MLLDRVKSKHNAIEYCYASKEYIQKLKYFDNFDSDITEMIRLTKLYMYPKKIWLLIGANETLFAVKIVRKWCTNTLNQNVHILSGSFVPKSVVLCHTINKQFEVV